MEEQDKFPIICFTCGWEGDIKDCLHYDGEVSCPECHQPIDLDLQ